MLLILLLFSIPIKRVGQRNHFVLCMNVRLLEKICVNAYGQNEQQSCSIVCSQGEKSFSFVADEGFGTMVKNANLFNFVENEILSKTSFKVYSQTSCAVLSNYVIDLDNSLLMHSRNFTRANEVKNRNAHDI